MSNKKYFNSVSDIHLEGCLNLPLKDLESFENTSNIKHLKFQAFQAKKELNKDHNRGLLKDAEKKIKERVKELENFTKEALQEMLLEKTPNMQFRNFEKLDKEELIKILEDYMLLDDLDEDNK